MNFCTNPEYLVRVDGTKREEMEKRWGGGGMLINCQGTSVGSAVIYLVLDGLINCTCSSRTLFIKPH